MEKSPPEILQGHVAQFQQVLAEVAALETRKTESENQLASLSENGDLNDKEVLSEIGRLQVFTQLFPSRLAATERSIGPAVDALRLACHAFINAHLMERAENLTSRVRAKIRAALAEHFQDEAALAAAVEKSALMNEAGSISGAVNFARGASLTEFHLDADGLIRRAQGLLAIWKQAEEFEAKLNSQP